MDLLLLPLLLLLLVLDLDTDTEADEYGIKLLFLFLLVLMRTIGILRENRRLLVFVLNELNETTRFIVEDDDDIMRKR